jgi:hypothetical protein
MANQSQVVSAAIHLLKKLSELRVSVANLIESADGKEALKNKGF